MARITVEDCLKKVNNRFVLINMVAKRVRQIREGSEYLVNSPKNEDIVVALREVAAGKVKIKDPNAAPVKALEEAVEETAVAIEESTDAPAAEATAADAADEEAAAAPEAAETADSADSAERGTDA